MRRRILFVVGFAAGYVIGARAGRPAYEAVVDRVRGIAGSDPAQQTGQKAKQVLEDKAPAVADAVAKVAETATAAASAAAAAGSDDTSEQTSGSAG